MRRYLKTTFSYCLSSMMPVIIGVILKLLYNDSIYSEGFVVTYPYQFLCLIGWSVFIIGGCKYGLEHQNGDVRNSGITGVWIYLVVYTIILICSIFGWNYIRDYFSITDRHKEVFVFWLSGLVFDWCIAGIATVHNYSDESDKAFKVMLSWYVYKISWIVVFKYINVENKLTVLSAILAMSCIVVMCYSCKCTFRYSLKWGIKYSYEDLPCHIMMLIIYCTGLSNVSSASTVIYVAYGIEAMCTDTQWDVLASVLDTVATLDINTGKFYKETKKSFTNAVLYSLILLISIVVCVVGASIIYSDADIRSVVIIAIIECFSFPLYAIGYTGMSYVILRHPGKYISLFQIASHTIRLCATLLIPSMYALSFGVIFSAFFGNGYRIILYKYFRNKDKELFERGDIVGQSS